MTFFFVNLFFLNYSKVYDQMNHNDKLIEGLASSLSMAADTATFN